MGVIATQADLLTKISSRHRVAVDKQSVGVTSDSGGWPSYWGAAGVSWPAGVNPTTAAGEAPNSSTVGAMPLPPVPGGEELYLASLVLAQVQTSFSNVGLCLYDRLVHTGGLSGTSTALQAVGSAALTRETTGEGVLLYLEIYTTVGTTATTATITYVNQAGTTKTTTVTLGATGARQAQNMLRVPLAEGDTGVRSVTDVTLAASTGTAGAFGFTLAKPICVFPTYEFADTRLDWADLALPKIPPSACVALWANYTGSGRPGFQMDLGFVTA